MVRVPFIPAVGAIRTLQQPSLVRFQRYGRP
jgi:hypothetical protein